MSTLINKDKYLQPQFLASLVTGFLFFVLVTQKYINERFSLLERASVGLLLLLIVIYFTNTKVNRIYISIPAAGLTLVMGISLIHMPATFIIRDYVAYLLIAIFAVVLISFFGIGAARSGVVVGLVLLIMANIVVLLTANPAISIGVSRFVGTSYGSNTLAASLIICIPAVLSMNSRGSIWRNLAKFILFFATAFFIILTGARTALITLVIIVSVWALYLISQKWRKALPYIWAFAGVTAAIVLFNVNQLLVLLGKSPSLSGRIPLWQAYLEKIGENPLIGYGWSFQTRIDMPLGLYISQVMGVPLSNAHDDFLNWWAQTGILGAVLFLLALSSILVFGFMLRKKSEYGLWLFFTGIAFAINGLTELTTMYGDGWMVFMMSSVAVAALIYQNLQSNTVSKFLSYSVNRPEMSTFTSN